MDEDGIYALLGIKDNRGFTENKRYRNTDQYIDLSYERGFVRE
jgi:hypothetical protein